MNAAGYPIECLSRVLACCSLRGAAGLGSEQSKELSLYEDFAAAAPCNYRIFHTLFDESSRPGKQCSLIVMLDVLEHLPDPGAALWHDAVLIRIELRDATHAARA